MDRPSAIVVGLVFAVCALQACAKKHSPQDSTETGNPPVIDADRVALVVQDDEVHVVGEKGAVEPGGATIQVTNLVSDNSASGRAEVNGSFDVKAPGNVNDGFSVQASSGYAKSKPVFVTEGLSLEGDGKSGALSCEQRTQLARDQITHAIDEADKTCTQVSDCLTATITADCYHKCVGPLASASGKDAIEASVAALGQGLCRDFKNDGCAIALPHCAGPGRPACMDGQCVYQLADGGVTDPGASDDGAVDAGNGGALSCTERENMAQLQFSRAVADADRSCTGDDDCVVAPSETDCFINCTFDVVSTKGEAQVRDVISVLNVGLCAGYRDDGCGFGEPTCKAPPKPVCKQGQCFGMFDAAMCEEAASLAQTRFDEASAKIERSCTQNSDCSYAPSPTCINPGCALTVVSKSSADQVQAIVDQLNEEVCAPAEAGGCSYQPSGPGCNPPATQCVQGVCQ